MFSPLKRCDIFLSSVIGRLAGGPSMHPFAQMSLWLCKVVCMHTHTSKLLCIMTLLDLLLGSGTHLWLQNKFLLSGLQHTFLVPWQQLHKSYPTSLYCHYCISFTLDFFKHSLVVPIISLFSHLIVKFVTVHKAKAQNQAHWSYIFGALDISMVQQFGSSTQLGMIQI